ncbi:MAG: TRAP transporter small permease subunit, partial [Gammaproteobacteria bacterium]
MIGYIVRRLLLMIPTLIGILFVSFVIIQFVPGGPVEQLVQELRGGRSGGGEVATSGRVYRGAQGIEAEQIAEIRKLYGFDRPAPERFVRMLERYLVFDLGTSYSHHMRVSELILDKMPVSISLGIWSFLIVYAVSIPLGIAKAVRDGSRFDVATSAAVLVGYAIPGFLIAILLVVLFAGVLARYVFHTPLVWSDELASILFLWLSMLGAVVALRRGEH